MEGLAADDLDNLIADSLGGVQTALEGERKAAPPAAATEPRSSAGEAIRELRQGPRADEAAPPGSGQELFDLLQSFQDESFQKAMADALQVGSAPASSSSPPSGEARGESGEPGAPKVEHFLEQFMNSFNNAVGSDSDLEQSLSTLMSSMLSKDLICEPISQLAEHLDAWLKGQKGLSAAERGRFEGQLRLYRQILDIYRQCPDPLPDGARQEVQRIMQELQGFGNPPDEVLRQIAPKDADEGGESFEDFIKQMGLDQGLGAQEQDLMKKLAEDPEELTKLMKGMASGMDDEACKQQ